MNSMLSGRLNRMPVGYPNSGGASYGGVSASGPTALQGGLSVSGSAGTNGAGGVGGVLLLFLAGLGVFYFATRSMQGLR